VEDESGELLAVSPENISNEAGESLSQLQLSVHIEGRNSLLIAPGIPAHLTLDFDLNTSNQVDFSGADPVLTVQPILLADVQLEKPKPHRLRGPLSDVDPENSQFEISIRPFRHRFNRQNHFGQLTVDVSDQTYYEINGETYQGGNGLAELDALPLFTATVAVGELQQNGNRYTYQATEVYAGSSVPGSELDVVRGNVIARSGDQLTVRGATLIRKDGSAQFRDNITVQLDAETEVTKQFSTESHQIDEISVGQRVLVFGELTSDESSLSADHLRMLVTVLNSTRVSSDESLLVDLQKIDGRTVSIFDFTGTGLSAETDADPSNYEVDHGDLDISQLAPGVPLRVIGFVTPFASAPVDFTARSLVDMTEVPAVMTLGYGEGSVNAFSDISTGSLTMDLSDCSRFHHLGRAGVVIDLMGLDIEPIIVPHGDGDGSFWIKEGGAMQLHTDFATFTADLESRVTQGALVKGLYASGDYVDQSGVLTSRMVIVKLL
jgi:hypothetical protein